MGLLGLARCDRHAAGRSKEGPCPLPAAAMLQPVLTCYSLSSFAMGYVWKEGVGEGVGGVCSHAAAQLDAPNPSCLTMAPECSSTKLMGTLPVLLCIGQNFVVWC